MSAADEFMRRIKPDSAEAVLGRVVTKYEDELADVAHEREELHKRFRRLRQAVFDAGRKLNVCLAPSRPTAVLDAIVTHFEVRERMPTPAHEDYKRQAEDMSTLLGDLDDATANYLEQLGERPQRLRSSLEGSLKALGDHALLMAHQRDKSALRAGDLHRRHEMLLDILGLHGVDDPAEIERRAEVIAENSRAYTRERVLNEARKGIYIAAPWSDKARMQHFAGLAREHVQVNSTWHDEDRNRGPSRDDAASERAKVLAQIRGSACVIAFDSGESKGLWYEVGIADALGVPVLLISRTSNGVSLPDSHRKHWRYSADVLGARIGDDTMVLRDLVVSDLRAIARNEFHPYPSSTDDPTRGESAQTVTRGPSLVTE